MYARTLLDCATANADGRARALVVGGGIANFTDVAATFKGIIQVCMHDYQHDEWSDLAINLLEIELLGLSNACPCP